MKEYKIGINEIAEKHYFYFDCPKCGNLLTDEGAEQFGIDSVVICDGCKSQIKIVSPKVYIVIRKDKKCKEVTNFNDYGSARNYYNFCKDTQKEGEIITIS